MAKGNTASNAAGTAASTHNAEMLSILRSIKMDITLVSAKVEELTGEIAAVKAEFAATLKTPQSTANPPGSAKRPIGKEDDESPSKKVKKTDADDDFDLKVAGHSIGVLANLEGYLAPFRMGLPFDLDGCSFKGNRKVVYPSKSSNLEAYSLMIMVAFNASLKVRDIFNVYVIYI